MSYSEVLARVIQHSGKTYVEITDIAKDKYGCEITASYLSKLKTGKEDNPRDEVTAAIALACDVDPDILLYESYIKKAPLFLRQYILNTLEITRNAFWSDKSCSESSPDTVCLDKASCDTLSGYTSDATIMKYYNKSFLKTRYKGFLNPKQFAFVIEDDSMAPRIPPYSVVFFNQYTGTVEDGDLVVAQLEDKSHIVRTYFRANGTPVLVPENKGHKALALSKVKTTIVGVVNSIKIPINQGIDNDTDI